MLEMREKRKQEFKEMRIKKEQAMIRRNQHINKLKIIPDSDRIYLTGVMKKLKEITGVSKRKAILREFGDLLIIRKEKKRWTCDRVRSETVDFRLWDSSVSLEWIHE